MNNTPRTDFTIKEITLMIASLQYTRDAIKTGVAQQTGRDTILINDIEELLDRFRKLFPRVDIQ